MTGQDFQDRLDALVGDLQTSGKGQTVSVMFRSANGAPNIFPLSSNPQGVVNADQLLDIQAEIDGMKTHADAYTTQYAPLQVASDVFKTASELHQALADVASLARKNYSDAIAADPAFQAAKTTLDNARLDPDYVTAAANYKENNISENFAELGNAKGKYLI